MSKKWLVGVHFHDGIDHTRRCLDGIYRYLAEQPELELRYFNFLNDDHDTSGAPPWTGLVDGVIVSAGRIDGIVKWLLRGRVPIVSASGDLASERLLSSVFTDDRSIAASVLDHFQSIGRTQVGFVGHRPSDASNERKKVLAQLAIARKLPFESYETLKVMSGTFRDYVKLDDVEPELLELLNAISKPCALYCLNDRLATTTVRLAGDLGFAVPEDIAVLGTGDFAQQSQIPISSIRTDSERIGYESIRLLHEMFQSGEVKHINIKVPIREIVPRESTIGKRRAATTDVERALQFIRDRVCENILVKDVADYVQMPLRTFEIEFTKAVGHSVGHEMRQVRLERAQNLLTSTQLPLHRIAKMVGLTDSTNLNRFFLRWSNQSAAQYRQAATKDREAR